MARPLRIELSGAAYPTPRVETVAKTATPMTLTAAAGQTSLATCALATNDPSRDLESGFNDCLIPGSPGQRFFKLTLAHPLQERLVATYAPNLAGNSGWSLTPDRGWSRSSHEPFCCAYLSFGSRQYQVAAGKMRRAHSGFGQLPRRSPEFSG